MSSAAWMVVVGGVQKPRRLPKERRWRTAVKSEEDREKKCLTDV